MSEAIWDRLKGERLAINLDLRELLISDSNHAVFRADYLDSTENVVEVMVQLFVEDGRYPGERVNRFLEATYLDDPHILHYITAGTVQSDEVNATYSVTERTDGLASRDIADEEAQRFAQDVMSGLEYLHSRNLVYCVLSPDTVVPVGADWKLSDFSQLRVTGADTSDEALSLSTTLDTSPPEAVEGLISPAWDIWAFGQTLRRVLTSDRANLPDPFRAVVLACLNVNPSARPTLTQLSGLLKTTWPTNREYGKSNVARA